MDTAPPYVAARTCTVVDEGEPPGDSKERTAALGEYANAPAYVLIAEPGADKTTSFTWSVVRGRCAPPGRSPPGVPVERGRSETS